MATPNKQVAGSSTLPVIKVVSRRLVKASDPSIEPYVLPVSNLDLTNTIQGSVVCVYPKPSNGGDLRAIVATFETHLPSFLNYFFPWAGRIVRNPTSGLPELHCLNQGAELVIGEVGVALESLDWAQSRASLKMIQLPYGKDVALSVQVISFACGGFAVVWASNNIMGDGNTAMRTVMGWTELLRTGTVAGVRPGRAHNDRSRHFQPRDPPTYSPAFAEMFRPSDHERSINALTVQDSTVERLYYVEARDIARLHKIASLDNNGGKQQRVSRVHAFSAYTWKVLAGVVAASPRLSREEEKRCGLLWWVDARSRFSSPHLRAALRHHLGTVCFYAHAEERARAVLDKPLADVAAAVRDAIASRDYDALFREFLDWAAEAHKHGGTTFVETPTVGLGNPTLAQTMWCSFPTDMDFGFGQAALAMPVDACFERLGASLMLVGSRPGGDGSWIVSAEMWRCLAEALEADEQRIFKPLTAEYLGFTSSGKKDLLLPTDQQMSRL